jgi:hypothetical protein
MIGARYETFGAKKHWRLVPYGMAAVVLVDRPKTNEMLDMLNVRMQTRVMAPRR